MVPEKIQQSVRESYQQLCQKLAGFVPRRAQNYLVAEIVKTLSASGREKRILVAEAGTGTGKSLAYAQAAIPCAHHLKKKLVISTATLSLQEQLINKDLPFFQSFSTTPFRFALVKGRQRYCCAERLEALAKPDAPAAQLSFEQLLDFKPSAAQQRQVKQLWNAYSQQRWQGDRDSWPHPIDERLWSSISAERHICNPILPQHRECPLHKARSALIECDVLVVNHALLLADLALGGSILPPPEECFYVLDEAHHLAEIAREQAAAQCELRSCAAWLGKLPQLGDKITKLGQQRRLQRFSVELADLVHEIQHGLKQWLELLTLNDAWFATENIHRFPLGELPAYLTDEAQQLQLLSGKLSRLLEQGQTILSEQFKEAQGSQLAITAQLLAECGYALERATQLGDLWQLFARETGQNPLAKWIERDESGQEFTCLASPLAMGPWLQRVLWERCAGAIMVSATLTAMNSFSLFRDHTGLRSDDGTLFLRLASPFDYQRAELLIPHMPCEPSSADFTAALIATLPTYLQQQKASLVLFASHRQMQEVASALRQQGFELLVQGEASREALLTLHGLRCSGNGQSILFGSASFAEGVDLPGELLTNLIITKLPFAVPTSPVEAAMAEWITARGGNPFLQLTVPEASRKLIQACGRLIRKEEDGGRVIILDRRLLTRHYGAGLLAALPPFRRNYHY